MKVNKLFSPNQIGFITEINEVVNIHSSEDFIKSQFESDDEISALPVESDEGLIGIIERERLFSRHKSLLGSLVSGKIDDIITRSDFKVDALEGCNKALQEIVDNKKRISVANVYHNGRFYGVVTTEKLIQHVQKLRSNELAKASEIQKKFTGSGSFEDDFCFIEVKIKMAHDVGGDFFHIKDLTDNLTLVSCFDVSGKDISASLITGILNGYFSTIECFDLAKNIPPLEIVKGMNKIITEKTPEGIFIASLFAFIDRKAKVYSVYNMGYCPLYIMLKSEGKNVVKTYSPQYHPIGFPGVEIDDLSVIRGKIQSQSRIFGYSDGLTDALNRRGEQFGEERVKTLIKNTIKTPNEDYLKTYLDEVNEFIGDTPSTDDITIFNIFFK
ncbi:MAG: SpoIIE family protein phosphatase [Spirochaetes bacterium]|nr:SpoIIE family protein phosphatase [Spirochaetota bacterium]